MSESDRCHVLQSSRTEAGCVTQHPSAVQSAIHTLFISTLLFGKFLGLIDFTQCEEPWSQQPFIFLLKRSDCHFRKLYIRRRPLHIITEGDLVNILQQTTNRRPSSLSVIWRVFLLSFNHTLGIDSHTEVRAAPGVCFPSSKPSGSPIIPLSLLMSLLI